MEIHILPLYFSLNEVNNEIYVIIEPVLELLVVAAALIGCSFVEFLR